MCDGAQSLGIVCSSSDLFVKPTELSMCMISGCCHRCRHQADSNLSVLFRRNESRCTFHARV